MKVRIAVDEAWPVYDYTLTLDGERFDADVPVGTVARWDLITGLYNLMQREMKELLGG